MIIRCSFKPSIRVVGPLLTVALIAGCGGLFKQREGVAPSVQAAVDRPQSVDSVAIDIPASEPAEVADRQIPGLLVVEVLLANDREDRFRGARRLVESQRPFLQRKATHPMEEAAQLWLWSYLEPKNEHDRRSRKLGPHIGVEDIYHAPGYELYLQAGDGLLIFARNGELIGRIEGGEGLSDLAMYDIDDDGQAEIFLKFDSSANSGNRFTEIVGYKEQDGDFEQILERRLYETAFRWVRAGLGSRLALVHLQGTAYVVIEPEGEAEFLRWDLRERRLVNDGPRLRRGVVGQGG